MSLCYCHSDVFTYSDVVKHLLGELVVMDHPVMTRSCTTLSGSHDVLQRVAIVHIIDWYNNASSPLALS